MATATKQKAAIIVPFYRDSLSDLEQIALTQCFKMLGSHPIIAIKPVGLKLTVAEAYPFTEIIDFEDHFFKNIEGYNRLMLSEVFYGRFLDYEYILIHQLDVFVFKDELMLWCSKDYDYIGAPWIRRKKYSTIAKGIVSVALQYLHRRYNVKKHGLPTKKQFDDAVGNGGFSLRRTQVFYDCCLKYREQINYYNNQPSHHFNEDVFWSLELNRKKKVLKIPGYREALKFAVEFYPTRAISLNGGELPFGCHAFDRFLDEWRPIFAKYGYEV